MTFCLHLLGGARVELNGHAVVGRATQRRRLALLVLLALSPRRTMTRERVLGYLWPDSSPDAARKLLSEAVYILRRELGDAVLTPVGDELTLGEVMVADVDRFRAAVAVGDWTTAANAYTGPLLDGWFVRDAPEFERWVESERARLAESYITALRKLADSCEAEGDWSAAARWWQAVVRHDPYGSAAVQRAARALIAAGERAAALQLLLSHESLLQKELGVGLDRTLTALVAEIRANADSTHSSSAGLASGVSTSANGESRLIDAPYPVAPIADMLVTTSLSAPLPAPSSIPDRSWKRRSIALIVAVAAVSLTVGFLRNWKISAASSPMIQTAPGDALRRRVAVMYFRDETPDHSLGYLADGLTEGLIRELTGFQSLRVLSQDAVYRFRDRPVDLPTVQQELGAGVVVNGSVRSKGDSAWISYRLVDVRSGEQLASESIGAPVVEPMLLAAELSLRVAASLRRILGADVLAAERGRAGAVWRADHAAVALLYRATGLRREAQAARNARDGTTNKVWARQALRAADSLLARAEVVDPTWPEPAIERGWVAATSGRLEHGTARVVALLPGIGHVERALALVRGRPPIDSATLARALHLRGVLRLRSATAVQTFRPESSTIREGVDDLQTALAVDSTLAGAWASLSFAQWVVGRFEASEAAATRALEADAYLVEAPEVIGWAWRSAAALGRRDVAERWCRRGQQMVPGDWHFVECRLSLMRRDAARLDGRLPDPDRAWEIVRELERIDPTVSARALGHPYSPHYRLLVVAAVLASAGQRDSARAMLTRTLRAVQGDAELSVDVLFDAAFLRHVLGDHDAAERDIGDYLRARPDLAAYVAREEPLRAVRDRGVRR